MTGYHLFAIIKFMTFCGIAHLLISELRQIRQAIQKLTKEKFQ